ncbi:DUF4652 domain-containing protein [Bacillus cereus]|uniref:DUF4652 domain-containing protein n=1 Tax=Bacillus cereus TaxID=1396 RepID=UPI000B4C192D|nr:DUF4652 domain-containing protein [Bacillus cereus]
MYKLYYDESAGIITVENENGYSEILADSYSSEPKFSPDGTKAIYITPLEWEHDSQLYLFDLKTGDRKEIKLDIDIEKEKAKDAIWLNESILLIIIGGLHGTVNVGGDIYRYNFEDGNLVKVIDCRSEKKQAMKLNQVDEFLSYEVLEYIDDILNQYIMRKEKVLLQSII